MQQNQISELHNRQKIKTKTNGSADWSVIWLFGIKRPPSVASTVLKIEWYYFKASLVLLLNVFNKVTHHVKTCRDVW